jgi:hypothetical protein
MSAADIAALAAAITTSQKKGVTIAGTISDADGATVIPTTDIVAVMVTSSTKTASGLIRNNIAKRTLFVPDDKSTSGWEVPVVLKGRVLQTETVYPNPYVSAIVIASIEDEDSTICVKHESQTELDSHANMFVGGKHTL